MPIDYEARRRQDREDRLLKTADFWFRPAYWMAEGLKMMMTGVGVIVFFIVALFFMLIFGPTLRQNVNDEMRQNRRILVLDPNSVQSLHALEVCEYRPGYPNYLVKYSTPGWVFWNNVIFSEGTWVNAKSAPMNMAFSRGVYSLAQLRIETAWHQHQDWYKREGFHSACGTPNTEFVMREFSGEEAAVQIKAPILHIAVSGNTITGMCLVNECTEEDFEFDTSRDLRGEPSFTEHQKHAMQVLNSFGDTNFWRQTAASNGIAESDLSLVGRGASAAELHFPDTK